MDKELEEMRAKYGSPSQESQQIGNSSPNVDPELEEMRAKYSGQPSSQLPSMTDYAKTKYNEVSDYLGDTDKQAQEARDKDTSLFRYKSALEDAIPSVTRAGSKLTALGSGALQGGAEAGQALARLPNLAISGINEVANTDIPKIPMPEINASPYEFQQQANAAHPGFNVVGNVAAQSALAAPMFGETMLGAAPSAAKVIGTGAAVGGAETNTDDPYARIAGAALGATGAAIPIAVGNTAQGLMRGITGTAIDPEAVAAYKALGIEEKVPHVYKTTDTDAQQELTNSIAPAMGNKDVREGIKDLSNSMDQKSNDILSSFDVRDANGAPLTGSTPENGPNQAELRQNIVDKANAEHQHAKDQVREAYGKTEHAANEAGSNADVSIDGYIEKLNKIASGDRNPHEDAVKFAKLQLDDLKQKGLVDKEGNATSSTTTDAFGAPISTKKLSFQEATDLDKKINDEFGFNKGASYDPRLNHDLSSLKSSLNNDIDASVEKNGTDDLKNSWKEAKKTYQEKEAPFYNDPNIAKFLHKGSEKASPDEVLNSMVKNDRPEELKKILQVVPSIKEDLGLLKIRNAGNKQGKMNNSDVSNALESIRLMSPEQGQQLFGKEKWDMLGHLKTAQGKLKPLLDYGANPNTGGRVQKSEARKWLSKGLTGAELMGLGGAMASGHAIPATAIYGGKKLGEIGVNKMKSYLAANPKAFETANAQSLLTPTAQKTYRSILAGSGNSAASSLAKKDDRK